jgi:hypothetical protein
MQATKRLSKNWMMQGSYTYSRTLGNYPGLFSPDNGQVDPNISSQYDLIELLANRDGSLPHDRPHSFKLDGYYMFDLGKKWGKIIPGTRFRAYSGNPINALGRHHRYGRNESFLLPRGEMGRIPPYWFVDLRLVYQRDLGRGMNLEVWSDLFNVLNRQKPVAVDDEYTLDETNPIVGGDFADLIWLKSQTTDGGETPNPAQRKLSFNEVSGRTSPLFVEIGARLNF